jgi:hypothetical protein
MPSILVKVGQGGVKELGVAQGVAFRFTPEWSLETPSRAS